MNILILYKKKVGGVGTVIVSLRKEFPKRGHKVVPISREDDLNIYSLAKSIFPLRRKVREIVKEEKIDIIYAQDWSMAFPLLFPTRMYRDKLFCVFYGEESSFISIQLQKMVGKLLGTRVISCTDSLKKLFPKSTLIYNRVDSELFKPRTQIKKIKDSVGFASWKTDEYSFSAVKEAVKKAGKRLVIAEGVPKEKMPEFFNTLECFITLPPTYSGFGLASMEAMASGVPKIIGNMYGGCEILPITKIEEFGGDISEAILHAKKEDYRKWIMDNKFTWKDATIQLEKMFSKANETKI